MPAGLLLPVFTCCETLCIYTGRNLNAKGLNSVKKANYCQNTPGPTLSWCHVFDPRSFWQVQNHLKKKCKFSNPEGGRVSFENLLTVPVIILLHYIICNSSLHDFRNVYNIY